MFKNFRNALYFGALLLTMHSNVFSQNVGINSSGASPDASAGLDVNFTDKGVLIPRVALTATNAAGPITSPSTSLLVYNTATAGTKPRDVYPGFYYWDGNGWARLLDNIPQKTVLSSNVATTLTTLGDVTGLSFAVAANKTYKFKFVIYYTASATSVGARFTINGPTFATNGLYFTTAAHSTTVGGWSIQPQIAYNSGVALGSSYTTSLNYCEIEGTVATTAAGTVIARFATETASSTTITVLGTGALVSYVEWKQLN